MSRLVSFLLVTLCVVLATCCQVYAGGKGHYQYGGEVPAVPEYHEQKPQYPGYGKSMPGKPAMPQLGLQVEQLPEETMPEEYLQPVVETKFVDQDIIKKRHVTSPIIRQVVVEQPIKRHRKINQPLIRKIIHQTVNRPHIHEQTVVKRPVFTQPIIKPSVQVQNTVKQHYSEEHFNQQQNLPETKDFTNYTLYKEAGLQQPIVMQAPPSERLHFPPSQGKQRFQMQMPQEQQAEGSQNENEMEPEQQNAQENEGEN